VVRVLLPFVREGLQVGDKGFHIIDSQHRAEHLDRLKKSDIDVEEAERKGVRGRNSWPTRAAQSGWQSSSSRAAAAEGSVDR